MTRGFLRANTFSIAQQVFAGLLLVSLIPALIIGYQSYHCSRQAVTELQGSALNAQLNSAEKQIRNWADEREKDLHSLAKESCLLGCSCTSKKSGCRLFNLATTREHTYEAIYLYDENWTLLNHYPDDEDQKVDMLTQEQKARVATGDGLVFSSAHTHTQGTISINVSSRLNVDGQARVFAVVVLNATHAIRSVLKDENSPYAVRIVDSSGRNILDPINSGDPAPNRLPTKILTGTRDLQFYDNDKSEQVVGVSKQLPGMDWTLVVETSKEDTFRWLETLRTRALLTASASLALTLLLAALLTRSITAPFKALANAARKISSGMLNLRVKTPAGKEQRDLAVAFNEMLDSLERLRLELTRQSALAAIGQLSSSVVHELRNPLSSVRMNLQALQKKVEGDPLHTELAEIAREQTDRMESLLNDLLLFGKPITLNRKSIPYHNLEQWISKDAQPLLADTDIRLDFENGNGSMPPLHIDVQKIRQVFSNLIENALHACDKKGLIQITAHADSAGVKITVHDSGKGISPALLPEVFRPFVTGRSEGTGLGLANVKKIVELHGGNISALNHENGGAEFVIWLPAIKEELT